MLKRTHIMFTRPPSFKLIVIFGGLLIFAPACATADMITLAAWNASPVNSSGDYSADYAMAGIVATASGEVRKENGSNDGTYGSGSSLALPAAPSAANGTFLLGPAVVFSLTNNSSTNYMLNSAHFDYAANGADNSPSGTRRYIGFQIGDDATVLTPTEYLPTANATANYNDVDLAITTTTFNAGETVVFTISSENALFMSIDNIAIVASPVIPEPMAISLIAFGGLTILLINRRLRS